MPNIETWIGMIEDGPDHGQAAAAAGGGFISGKIPGFIKVLLVQLAAAKTRFQSALSSATRVEGPANNFQNYSFVLAPVHIILIICIHLAEFISNFEECLNQYAELIE
jgi:hypothetical protein